MSEHQDKIKAITSDEYAGQGGSYLYDANTGTRTLIQPDESKAESQQAFIESAEKE